MLFNLNFVESSRNAADNWAIVEFLGAKRLVASGIAVGGADITEVIAEVGRGGCRAEIKGSFLFYSSHMTDMT